jgi:hypothetical protein
MVSRAIHLDRANKPRVKNRNGFVTTSFQNKSILLVESKTKTGSKHFHSNNMSKKYNFKLIHGTFTGSEATRMLFDLIGSKINFHTMENFSSRERLGQDAPFSDSRVSDLKKVKAELQEFFKGDDKKELKLKIEDCVKITILE